MRTAAGAATPAAARRTPGRRGAGTCCGRWGCSARAAGRRWMSWSGSAAEATTSRAAATRCRPSMAQSLEHPPAARDRVTYLKCKTVHHTPATATVPAVRRVFFPLDKQLALLPGRLTPLLQDQLAHLGVWMPFAKAADLLASFTHTSVSESTAQRLTEAIGLAYEAVQLAEVERIERDWPAVEHEPDKLILSLDGAFVPLLHGEWAEAKTLVVSEVGQPKMVDGKTVVSTHSHSYFSRVA